VIGGDRDRLVINDGTGNLPWDRGLPIIASLSPISLPFSPYLVFGRSLDALNDQHFDGQSRGFQFQTKFFECAAK
jgi:hypothetical protein